MPKRCISSNAYVYDTALMTDDRIKDAVQKDLNDYIGTGKVDFNIHTGPDMISLVFTCPSCSRQSRSDIPLI